MSVLSNVLLLVCLFLKFLYDRDLSLVRELFFNPVQATVDPPLADASLWMHRG